ncbi:ABC transporter substrate-binding protein [Kaistia sp. 32K]|uniref:ABC transporter substrate-binding protein n=1 Tax=Kaistia sp. 32K TaxID=2795690 RepID=UPI0019158EFC|nr:extracellular solute-binding protein [Kaistia sp. 32K]BCP55192.1 ABC transporter substrate-binding protein [Kaistia sp. 32K]
MRLIRLLSAAALAVGAAAMPAHAQDAPLTFMTFETPALNATFWDGSIARASEKVPGLTVKKIISPSADRNAYAKQLQASGQFPDILASINPKDFIEAELLLPFDQSWLEENFIQPGGNTIDGKVYIPPTNAQVIPLVYYNKDVFAKHGLQPPKTWAELVNVVKTLRAGGVTPMELAGAEPWAAGMPLVALASADVLGKDPDWIRKRFAGEVKFSDPLFAKAMQKAVDLVGMGAYDPGALSVDFTTANKNFLDGKSAMYAQGSWLTGSGYISAEKAANVGVFPWPTDDGTIVIPFNVGGTTSVSAGSKAPDQAIAFAKAWSLDPKNLATLIETDGAFPMMKKLSLADFGVKVSGLFEEAYGLATADSTKVSAFGWVNNDNALAPGVNDLFYALSQSFFSDTDVAGQLARLDADWDAATGR